MLRHFALNLYSCRVSILVKMTMERYSYMRRTGSEVYMTSCYHAYSGYVFSSHNNNIFLL